MVQEKLVLDYTVQEQLALDYMVQEQLVLDYMVQDQLDHKSRPKSQNSVSCTHFYAVSLWEIHANFHAATRKRGIKPLKKYTYLES